MAPPSASLASSPVTPTNRRPYHYPFDPYNGRIDYGTFIESDLEESTSSSGPSHENHDQVNDNSLDDRKHLIQKRENAYERHVQEASNSYTRYRYYNRLFNKSSIAASDQPNAEGCENDDVLLIPDHVIPWYFMLPRCSLMSNIAVPEDRKQSSIVTIFAIWNMMMGTSLLCLPWALQRAGLVGGLFAMIFMIGVCFYTASLIIEIPKLIGIQVTEFTDVVQLLLSSIAHKVAQFSSLSIITGGCIVYWILMTNFLRHIITFVYQIQFGNTSIGMNASAVICANDQVPEKPQLLELEDIAFEMDSQLFNTILDYAVPSLLVLLLGPLICLKSASIFLRFNIVGTLSVFYLIGFALFKAYHWGVVNMSFDPNHAHFMPLFSWNFPVYTGVMSLALFIHNCLTTLLKTQKRPEHNRRDLAIAYVLVGVTYLLIGTAIYISFPLDKRCIRDNFLDNLQSNDLYACVTRIFLLLQVVALYPLLCYMLRIQVLSLLHPDDGHLPPAHRTPPPTYHLVRVVWLNSALLTVCILFATYYPQIGGIIRYCGSFSGLLLIFTFPPLCYVRARRVSQKPVPFLVLLWLGFIVCFGVFNFVSQFLVTSN